MMIQTVRRPCGLRVSTSAPRLASQAAERRQPSRVGSDRPVRCGVSARRPGCVEPSRPEKDRHLTSTRSRSPPLSRHKSASIGNNFEFSLAQAREAWRVQAVIGRCRGEPALRVPEVIETTAEECDRARDLLRDPRVLGCQGVFAPVKRGSRGGSTERLTRCGMRVPRRMLVARALGRARRQLAPVRREVGPLGEGM